MGPATGADRWVLDLLVSLTPDAIRACQSPRLHAVSERLTLRRVDQTNPAGSRLAFLHDGSGEARPGLALLLREIDRRSPIAIQRARGADRRDRRRTVPHPRRLPPRSRLTAAPAGSALLSPTGRRPARGVRPRSGGPCFPGRGNRALSVPPNCRRSTWCEPATGGRATTRAPLVKPAGGHRRRVEGS